MAIPGARIEEVPPALPPPRYIRDLDDGVDISWNYQNNGQGHSKLAPIKTGSSLLGHPQLRRSVDIDMDMDIITDYAAHSDVPSHIATGIAIPNLVRRPPSSSGISQR